LAASNPRCDDGRLYRRARSALRGSAAAGALVLFDIAALNPRCDDRRLRCRAVRTTPRTSNPRCDDGRLYRMGAVLPGSIPAARGVESALRGSAAALPGGPYNPAASNPRGEDRRLQGAFSRQHRGVDPRGEDRATAGCNPTAHALNRSPLALRSALLVDVS
ncbi:MAG: hypothetical protein ABI895_43385, partial [Deltaproteobacteria bacterium]